MLRTWYFDVIFSVEVSIDDQAVDIHQGIVFLLGCCKEQVAHPQPGSCRVSKQQQSSCLFEELTR